jgi:hypothetical protein
LKIMKKLVAGFGEAGNNRKFQLDDPILY